MMKIPILILIAIFVQLGLLIYIGDDLSLIAFLNGAPNTSQFQTNILTLMAWYFPISLLCFYFMNHLKEKYTTYGPLLFTRANTRVSFLIKTLTISFGKIGVYLAVQTFIFGLFMPSNKVFSLMDQILVITLHGFVLCVVITLQVLLEMYISTELALIIVNVYILLPGILMFQGDMAYWNYFMVTNYSMLYRNGYLILDKMNPSMIDGTTALLILVVVEVLLLLCIARKIKRLDIL